MSAITAGLKRATEASIPVKMKVYASRHTEQSLTPKNSRQSPEAKTIAQEDQRTRVINLQRSHRLGEPLQVGIAHNSGQF